MQSRIMVTGDWIAESTWFLWLALWFASFINLIPSRIIYRLCFLLYPISRMTALPYPFSCREQRTRSCNAIASKTGLTIEPAANVVAPTDWRLLNFDIFS